MANKSDKSGASSREAVVVLGGQEYVVRALNMKAARKWRAEFSQPIQQVLAAMRQMQDVELTDVAQVAQVLQGVGTYLLGSVDTLVDAMFAYAPVLDVDRGRIEEEADDVEAMGALWEVIKLAYPFGNLLTMLNRGAASTGKSKS